MSEPSQVSHEARVPGPAERVWESVADFGRIHEYLPAVSEITVEGEGPGATRTLILESGDRVVERLESIDPERRELRYSIRETSLPLERYLATMRVEPEGEDACVLRWSCEFEAPPEAAGEMADALREVYRAGSAGLAALHGG